MDYQQAFIKLYGAAGAALEELLSASIVTIELDNAVKILKKAINEVENMDR